MKRIMILGASILQLPAIKQAKELGFYVIVVDADPNAIGSQYADGSLLISTIDTNKILLAAKREKIDGIMTLATDLPIRSVAVVAEKLNLIGVSEDTAMCATHKFLMRERLALSRIPIPKFYKSSCIEDYYQIITRFNDAFIVKPADNSGSRGIFLVRSKTESETAYYHAMKYSACGEILIEEFMQGREVSVEAFSTNGQVHICAITDKLTTGAPFFVEIGHSQPAQFDNSTADKIKKVTTDAVLALGITDGPSHTEIIVTEEGPKVVEIGARLGGGCITTHLVPLSTGIDMVGSSIKLALGLKPELSIKFNKGCAIRFFKTFAGQIKAIKGVEEASSLKGVYEITLLKNEGDIINDLQCGSDRIGWVIAQGEDAREAIASCEKAMNVINISITNFNKQTT